MAGSQPSPTDGAGPPEGAQGVVRALRRRRWASAIRPAAAPQTETEAASGTPAPPPAGAMNLVLIVASKT